MAAINRQCLSLCWALLAATMALAAAQRCSRIPQVSAVDQSPTAPWNYGKCTDAVEAVARPSHWCKFGRIGVWPQTPPARAQQCLKFGRATIYRGPIYGSSPQHLAACNKVLRGSNEAALVALSTKYLKTYQGGWAGDKGACDQCMCIRMHGADRAFNPGLQTEAAQRHVGLTFLGKVGDRCSECADDSVDILMDRPFSYAPFNPNKNQDNTYAPFVNGKDGLRGFSDPAWMRGDRFAPESVGTWTADWQFVPCQGWSHDRCAGLMKDMGYSKVFVPKQTPGVDSFSLRPVSSLRTRASYLTEVPHCKARGVSCTDDGN